MIQVTFPDGTIREYAKGTSALQIATSISEGLARNVLSAKVNGEPCVTYIGPGASGHFVKMTHNGIEYADMQMIAEIYGILRDGLNLSASEIADVFAEWNKGRLNSYLIEITAEVLKQVDAKTGKPFVDVVLDAAGSKGTGVWTVQTALNLGTPVSGIAEAVFARSLSSQSSQRAGNAGMASHTTSWSVSDKAAFVEDVRKALYASKIIAYAQGFDAIRAGDAERAEAVVRELQTPDQANAAIFRRAAALRRRSPSPPGR